MSRDDTLFGVPKLDVSTRPISSLSDETLLNHSINNLIGPKLCTVEHAQTKLVVKTVHALGKLPGYGQNTQRIVIIMFL